MNFLTNLNLNKNELQNAVIQNLAVAPENPKEGQIYYNSKEKQYYGFRNGQWKILGADLPTISVGTVEGLQAALDQKADKQFEHTHANKAALDSITDQRISNWDDANSKKHTHNNKSVLDGITSQKVTNWDNSLGNAKSYTDQKIADLIGGAPEALDTLKELGDALTQHENEYNALLGVVGKKAEVPPRAPHRLQKFDGIGKQLLPQIDRAVHIQHEGFYPGNLFPFFPLCHMAPPPVIHASS